MAPCLIGLLLFAAQADTSPIAAAPLPRIATVDWTIAETLLALEVTPLAVGDAGPYQAWVGEPRLPAGVVDIGLRTQPNRELLALAGTLLQRVSNNPMASPELLGVSGGTFMGVIATALLLPALPLPLMLSGGLLGAFGCLLLLVVVNRKHGFQPERILLSGIAITALFEPLQAIALANGDMRVQQLLSWMSGSTYYVTLPVAYGLVGLALLMLVACLLVSRWLDLLPMGAAVATALGIRLNRAQLAILLLVAVLTASATLVGGAALLRRSIGAAYGQADGVGTGSLAPAWGRRFRRPADGVGGLGRPADPLPAGGAGRSGLHPVRGRLLHVVSAPSLGGGMKNVQKSPWSPRAFCCLRYRLICRCRSWRRCAPADRQS